MASVPTNNSSLPGHHPFFPHQREPQDSEGLTFLDSPRSHNFQDLGNFCGDSRVVPPHRSTLTHHEKLPVRHHLIRRRQRRQNMPGPMQRKPIQVSSHDSLPRAMILPPSNSQLTINSDGPHSLFNHHPSPVSMFFSGTSAFQLMPDALSQVPPQIASFKAPQQTSLQPAFTSHLTTGTAESVHAFPILPGAAAQTRNTSIPIPITSGLGPSSSSLLPLTRTNAAPPTSGPSTDSALAPIVRLWDYADTVPMSQPERAEPEPGPASVSHCPCCNRRRRVPPLVRVDNTVEWVREDVMKMTLLFNWSPNAEAEAHGSWEPRDA